MASAPFVWSEFEAALLDEHLLALGKLGKKHGDACVYAVALHGVYRELDGPLTLPLLAANTQDGAGDGAGGFWSERWNPADWRFNEIELRKGPSSRLERALTRHAKRGTQAQWRATDERYRRVLVRVVRTLRDAVLGRLGLARPEVLEALQEQAQVHGGGWFARALGVLGDHEWLLKHQDLGVRVDGLCAPLGALAWKDTAPTPLDYGPLARLLDGADEETLARVEEVLAPGSSYRSITSGEVPEALCGLESPHAVIRWHASSLLGSGRWVRSWARRSCPPSPSALGTPTPSSVASPYSP